MKLYKVVSLLLLVSLLVFNPSPIAANSTVPISAALQSTAKAFAPPQITEWLTGPYPPSGFQYARHDGAFVPGPALEPWANKVYFPGGRTSPPTESPNIWVFDPVTGSFTDTGADVIEDVSNYNANLIMDDGTGRGPAVYVIGGTDKDHGGINIGTVQRYYPQTNECEALPTADNWNGMVGGYRVAAVGSAVVNDVIYVYGGWQTSAAPYFSSETWAFDPNQPSGSRWTNLSAPLSTPRSYIMSAVQNGKVYAIGGVGIYVGGELDPVATFEVLDTANLAAGWTLLAPMPAPGGEGRAFGFDSDTLNIASPYEGKLFVVAPNDWAAVSGEVLEYDIATNTWLNTLPELPTPRADLAGTFVPLCTADPDDGLPGIWTFGGRVNESCDPPLGPTEYAPLACDSVCTGLTDVAISGPAQLMVGETGVYSASILPLEASAPVSLLWSNGLTATETSYSWDIPGSYTIVITSTNCDGTAVVTDTLVVDVLCSGLTGAEITGPASLFVGETGSYSVSLTPPTATLPLDILWSSGVTETQADYSWDVPGTYDVSVTASNCSGASVVTDTQAVAILAVKPGTVTISGPENGLPNTTYTFTATVEPLSTTLPLTYTWGADDQLPVTHTAELTDTVAFSWDAPGVYAITVDAATPGGTISDTHAITIAIDINIISPTAVTLSGPESGLPGTVYTFTAAVEPLSTTLPLTYTWQADGQSPLTQTADLTDTAAFLWDAPGTYTITVQAANAEGIVSATHTITIAAPTYHYFLPVIQRKL